MSTLEKNNKHAYLIMAHNEFGILKKLISLLDDSRNDIFLHVDKKTKLTDIPIIETKKASLKLIKQTYVSWGGHSQIQCELNLLKEATKEYHQYYHLISGVDLPLKTQDYIHDFFAIHNGKNFIRFDDRAIQNNSFIERVQYYYLFQNVIGRNSGKLIWLLEKMENLLLIFQKQIKVDRTQKANCKFYKGTNWFSITHEMALGVLAKENFIKRFCYYSKCADEVFLQTVSMNSKFKETIMNDSLRYVDWIRGKPYVFTSEDYYEIIRCDKLFARKFSEKKDAFVVQMIYNYIMRKQNAG